MDRLLTRLERRFGRFAPSGITIWLVGLTGLAWVMLYLRPELTGEFTLDRQALAAGEWWRLVSFLFLPWNVGTTTWDAFFAIFDLWLLYIVGNSLESQWGSFRFELFYLLAALATIGASLLFGSVTNLYINEALILAFATEFPDYELMMLFILPVKMKWLGYLMAGVFVWQFVSRGMAERAGMIVAIGVFLIFCGGTLLERARGKAKVASQRRVRSDPASAFAPPAQRQPRVCARCGKSEKDDSRLEFRVCDCAEKCHGKLTEYCIDHARDH